MSLVAAAALTIPASAGAQDRTSLGPSEPRLQAASALERTRGADVRWDLATGTPARVRFAGGEAIPGETAADAACALLTREAGPLFDAALRVARSAEEVPPTGATLVLRGATDLGHDRVRVDFEEVVGGVPVLDSMLRVELATTGAAFTPASIFSRYYASVPASLGSFSSEVEGALLARFPSLVRGKMVSPTTWTRVVAPRPQGGYRLAFAVVAHLGVNPPLAFRLLVDGETGAELERSPLTCGAQATGTVFELNPKLKAMTTQPLAGLYVYQGTTQVVTDADGNHNLTGTVTLSADSTNDPGLAGPQFHVFVDGKNEIAYSGPAAISLDYAQTDYHADEVAAWFNAMSFNQACAATYGPMMVKAVATRLPILIDSSFENAFYSPTPTTFDGESFPGYADLGIFGTLSVAQDDTVVRHEHSHGFWQQLANLYGGPDDQALGINEGMADYFPCVYNEDPVLGAGVGPGVGIPYIRSCLDLFVWPKDDNGDPHRVGNIVTGALWEARMKADAANPGDRLKVDQAVFQGILRYGNAPTLLQARDAIVAGDLAANNGAFTPLLEECLFEHGIGPAPANQTPVLGAIADQSVAVGGTLTIAVAATDPDGDPIALAASALAGSTLKTTGTNPASGTFTFTPTASQVGSIRETFTATDGGLTATRTITITVTRPGTTAPPTTSPVGSSATLSKTGSVKPASTTAAAPTAQAGGGGGGGGGCALAAPGGGDALALLPYLLALAGGVAARARRNRSSWESVAP
jgi:hypothetical protein